MAEFEIMMKIMNEALLGPGFSDDGICATVKKPLHPAVKIYALHKHVSVNGVAEAALVQFLGNEYKHGWEASIRRGVSIDLALSDNSDPFKESFMPFG
jgi:hypothetical protein